MTEPSLSAWDDLLVHQTVAPVRQVAEDDPRFYDRYWFNIHDLDRRVVVSCGVGVYPNLDVIDGFAGVVRAGRQTSLRVSRRLGADRSRTEIGPLRVEVVEGLRTIRLHLTENDRGIAFDLTFRAIAPPHARLPMMHLVRDGRVLNHTCHFNQAGRVEGWVAVDGERIELTPERAWAVRDHSWGIRDGVGGPPAGSAERQPVAGRRANWRPANPFIAVQFPDRYLFVLGAGRTGATGEIIPAFDAAGETVAITAADFDLSFAPDSIRPARSEVRLTDPGGRHYNLTIDPWATFYLAGGGYGGHGGFWHGRPRGEFHQEGETWDLSDPETIAGIAGRDDHVCTFVLDGVVGYGVFEVGLRGDAPYAPFPPVAVK